MVQTAEEWYKQLPVVTRAYLTLAFLTTAGCALEIITPFQIYFNPRLIWEGQLWRLFTNFFYFGQLGLDFVFHMYFLVKYCRSLEEGSFRSRSADFFWMLAIGASLLTSIAFIDLYFNLRYINLQFLGPSLTFMLVYVWARRNQYVTMSFMGIFNFTAPFLPWVLMAFSIMLGSSPVGDLLGMAAGHIYYFLEDVYPHMSNGRRLLKTPAIVRALFAEEPSATQPPVVAEFLANNAPQNPAPEPAHEPELAPQGLHEE